MTLNEFLDSILEKKNIATQQCVATNIKELKKVVRVDMILDSKETSKLVINERRIIILGFKEGMIKETDVESLFDVVKKDNLENNNIIMVRMSNMSSIESSKSKSCVTYKFNPEDGKCFQGDKYKFYAVCWDAEK